MIRVLIVDDDKLARKGLLTMLPWAEHGMTVVGEAANGAKALEFLGANAVDLCFVDLMMPVMSGIDFIRAALARHPHVQFVVLTFHEDFGLAQTALRLGVLDYISKLELEHADYGQILRRLTQKLHAPDLGEGDGGMDAPDWEGELLSSHWLYDGAALEVLIGHMDQHPASLSAIERLLVRVALKIEEETRLPLPRVPTLTDHGQAAAYLGRVRTALLGAAKASSDLARLPTCILKAVGMAAEDIAQDLRTETVAARVGLSRPYFSSCFSREVGIPFNAYVRRERVRAAAALLQGGALTVPEVASRVGYEDVRSFGKLFFEQMGETPSAYRRRMGG